MRLNNKLSKYKKSSEFLEHIENNKIKLNEIEKNFAIKLEKQIIDEVNKMEREQPLKEHKNFMNNKFIFKFALSTTIFLIIFFSSLLVIYFNKNKQNNYSNVAFTSLNGNISLLENGDKKDINKLVNKNVKNNSLIITDKNAGTDLRIGNNSFVKLGENSELKIIRINNNKKNEIVKLGLEKGFIDCSVNLMSSNSIFRITTNMADFTVKGTKFQINYFDNNVKLDVTEGIVEVTNFFKISSTIKKNKILSNAISQINEHKLFITQNKSIIIKQKDLISFENELISYIDSIDSLEALQQVDINNNLKDISNKIVEKMFINKNLHESGKNINNEETIQNKEIKTISTEKKVKIETRLGNVFIGRQLDNKNSKIIKLETNLGIINIASDDILSFTIIK